MYIVIIIIIMMSDLTIHIKNIENSSICYFVSESISIKFEGLRF